MASSLWPAPRPVPSRRPRPAPRASCSDGGMRVRRGPAAGSRVLPPSGGLRKAGRKWMDETRAGEHAETAVEEDPTRGGRRAEAQLRVGALGGQAAPALSRWPSGRTERRGPCSPDLLSGTVSSVSPAAGNSLSQRTPSSKFRPFLRASGPHRLVSEGARGPACLRPDRTTTGQPCTERRSGSAQAVCCVCNGVYCLSVPTALPSLLHTAGS